MNMKTQAILAAVVALATATGGCGAISDAPEAGSERLVPISNNAYLVRQGPMLDRYWIDGPPTGTRPPARTPNATRQRLYK
jgi:hypothetical protein